MRAIVTAVVAVAGLVLCGWLYLSAPTFTTDDDTTAQTVSCLPLGWGGPGRVDLVTGSPDPAVAQYLTDLGFVDANGDPPADLVTEATANLESGCLAARENRTAGLTLAAAVSAVLVLLVALAGRRSFVAIPAPAPAPTTAD